MKNIKSYSDYVNEQAKILMKASKAIKPLVSELIDKMHSLLPKAYRTGEAFDVFMNGLKELDPADRKKLVQSVLKHSPEDGYKVSGKMVLRLPAKNSEGEFINAVDVPLSDDQVQILQGYLK